MYSRCRIQDARIRFGERGRSYITVIAASRDNDLCNSGVCGTLQDFIAIIIEAVMREVCANIYQ
jgi:hypothetical protein